ncbi:MAG: DUF3198 domain-containing protein [Thermoplasmata archaeon]
MALNNIWRNYGHLISGAIIGIFSVVTFIGIGGFEQVKNLLPDAIKSIENSIGNFYLWCIIVGPLMLLIFGWLLIDFFSKKKEFEKLISTQSKAQFIKNLQRIEELAFSLPEKYEKKIEKKKIELKVKI